MPVFRYSALKSPGIDGNSGGIRSGASCRHSAVVVPAGMNVQKPRKDHYRITKSMVVSLFSITERKEVPCFTTPYLSLAYQFVEHALRMELFRLSKISRHTAGSFLSPRSTHADSSVPPQKHPAPQPSNKELARRATDTPSLVAAQTSSPRSCSEVARDRRT